MEVQQTLGWVQQAGSLLNKQFPRAREIDIATIIAAVTQEDLEDYEQNSKHGIF